MRLKRHAAGLMVHMPLDLPSMRRGELLALRWADTDLDGARLRVERSLEETKARGLRFKAPKTKRGRRAVALPASVLDVLRDHRRKQLEQRVALGLGKMPDDALSSRCWTAHHAPHGA
jgi:integrase